MPNTTFRASSPATTPFTGQATITRLQRQLAEVGLEGFGGLELAAALEHQVHPGRGPGHGGGILLLGKPDRLIGHQETGFPSPHRVVPTAVDRVERQQVGGRGGVTSGIVDVAQADAGALEQGTEHQPADTAEPIDADVHRIAPRKLRG
jgi:hypothetical protein